MSINGILEQNREDIIRVANRHEAKNVRVFGSAARGEAGENSDIDLLVDMEPKASLFDLGKLVLDLQDLLGCKVDVVTEDSIYWLIRRRILKEARPL